MVAWSRVALDRSRYARERIEAAVAWAEKGGGAPAIDVLIALGTDMDVQETVRDGALVALARLSTEPRVTEAVSSFVTDPEIDGMLRINVAEAWIKNGGGKRAVTVLATLATDPWGEEYEEYVRMSAAESWAMISGDERALNILATFVANRSVKLEERVEAAQVWGTVSGEEQPANWLSALASSQWIESEVRLYATSALARMGRGDRAVEVLAKLASDQNIPSARVYDQLLEAAATFLTRIDVRRNVVIAAERLMSH
jgi:hypothetical protein